MDSIRTSKTPIPSKLPPKPTELDKLTEIFMRLHEDPSTFNASDTAKHIKEWNQPQEGNCELFQKIKATLQLQLKHEPSKKLSLIKGLNAVEGACHETLLMEACRSGDLEMVKLLLQDKEAELSKCNDAGQTVLEVAAQAPHPKQEILQILIAQSRIISPKEVESVLKVGSQKTKRDLFKAINRSNLLRYLELNRGGSLASTSSSHHPIVHQTKAHPLSQTVEKLSSFDKIKFFAHMLSDEWINGQEMKTYSPFKGTKKIEGFNSNIFLKYFKEHQEGLFQGISSREELTLHLNDLENVENWAQRCTFAAAMEELEKRGGTKYFLCHWNGMEGGGGYKDTTGHALSGKAVKNLDGTYDLYLFNTGDGNQFHPAQGESPKSPYGIVWRGIPAEKCQAPDFWNILSCTNLSSSESEGKSLKVYQTANTLYQSLNRFLNIAPEGYGDSITLQRSGTCSKQCFDTLFRDMIQTDAHSDRMEYKILKCRERIITIQDGMKAIGTIDPIHRPMLAAILEEGLAKLSISLASLKNRERQEQPEWIDEELITLSSTLIELQIQWSQIETKRNIATSLEKDTFIDIVGKKPSSKIPTPSPSSSISLKDNIPPKTSNISIDLTQKITSFHRRIATQNSFSVKEIDEWTQAFEELITITGEEYGDSPLLQAQMIDTYFLDLGRSIATRIERPLQPQSSNGLEPLIKAFTQMHERISKSHSKERSSHLWSMTLYLSSALLFNELNGENYTWASSFPIATWNFDPEWGETLDRLYQKCTVPPPPAHLSSKIIPIFKYEKYSESTYSQEHEIKKEHSPEYILSKTDAISILKELEKFKKFLGIESNIDDLHERDSLIYVKSRKYPKNTNLYPIDPQSNSDGLKIDLQKTETAAPEKQIRALINNQSLDSTLTLHPLQMKLMESMGPSQASSLLISRWLELLQNFQSSYKNDSGLQKSLRSALYNHHNPQRPSIKNGFSELKKCNRALVGKLIDEIKKGCAQDDFAIFSLSWELLYAIESQIKDDPEWSDALEKSRNSLRIQFPLERIKEMKNPQEKRFHLACYFRSELTSPHPQMRRILEGYNPWSLSTDKSDLTTFETIVQSLYTREIPRLWQSLTTQEQESLLQEIIAHALPGGKSRIQIEPNTIFPRAHFYDRGSNLSIGSYDGIEGRTRLKHRRHHHSDVIEKEFLSEKISSLFGDLSALHLIFNRENNTFELPLQNNLTFAQVEEDGKRFLEIVYRDPITGQEFTSFNTSFKPSSPLASNLIELHSPDKQVTLLCKWNSLTGNLKPQWKINNSENLITSLDSPTEGCHIEKVGESDLPKLTKFLERLPSDSHPIFWYEDQKLHYIQIPEGALFDCSQFPYRCYLDGVWYECGSFTQDEEPLELLNGYSFKLTDIEKGQTYWYGTTDYSGDTRSPNHLEPQEAIKHLKSPHKDAKKIFKLPIADDKLSPQSNIESLFLIDQMIQSKAYQSAIEGTKRLIDPATCTLSPHLEVLKNWNWRMIFLNPATRTIGHLFHLRLSQEVAHLPPEERKTKSQLTELHSNISKLHIQFKDAATHPKSKKRFLNQYQPGLNPTLTKQKIWKVGLHEEKAEQLPTLKHHEGLQKGEPVIVPLKMPLLDPSSTEKASSTWIKMLEDAATLQSKVPIANLIALYSSSIPLHDKELAAAILRKYYNQYHFHYVDFETKFKDRPSDYFSSQTKVAFHGFVGELIQEIATKLGFTLEIPENNSSERLPQYIFGESSTSSGSSNDLSLSAKSESPSLLPALESASVQGTSDDITSLEIKLISALSPRDELGATLGALHHEPIPTLEEASQMVLTKELAQWRSFRSYLAPRSDQELAQLHHDLLHYLALKTKPKDTASRSYDLEDPIAPFCLLYEEKSGMRLRKDQVNNLKFLLGALERNDQVTSRKMLQSLMGSGKSKVLTPLLLLYLQKQHHTISSYMTTKSLLGPAVEDLSHFLSEKFGIRTHQIQANRHMSHEALEILKEQIAEAKAGKAILFTSADTLHALHLSLPLMALAQNGKEDYELTCEIIKELQSHQALIIDECDSLLHPREQTSYPLGEPKPLPGAESKTATNLYFKYVSTHAKELRLAAKESHTTHLYQITQTILKELAEDLYAQRSNALVNCWIEEMVTANLDKESILTAIKSYLSDQKLTESAQKCLEKALGNSPPKDLSLLGSEEIGIYQYAFGKKNGLITSLQAPFKSSYGRSLLDKERHLVIPYSNSLPREGTQFQDGYQTLFKSCLYYLHEWTDPADTRLLLTHALKTLDNSLNRIKYPELVEAIEFYQIRPPIDEDQCNQFTERLNRSLNQRDSANAEAKHGQTLIEFFLNQLVFPRELKVYSEQLLSTSTTLVHSGAYQLGISGTREGSSSWEELFETKWDQKELPRVLEKAIQEKSTAIQVEGLSTSSEKIDAILAKMEENSRALIDVGGMFRGIAPKEVAHKLLQARPAAQGVLFYATLPSGLSELRILLSSGQSEKVEDSSRKGLVQLMRSKGLLPKGAAEDDDEKLFEDLTLLTFYDQAHTRGSDIPQKKDAHALLLYDEACTTTDLQQAVMRMRKYLEGQSLTWVYSSKEGQTLTAADMISQAEKRETHYEKLAYAQSLLDQLQHGVTDYLIQYALQGHSFEEACTLAEKMRHLLVDRSCSHTCFSPFLREPPSYLSLIKDKLQKITDFYQSLEDAKATTYFHPIIEKITNTVKESSEQLESLAGNSLGDLAVQEQNQDLNLEQALEQVRTLKEKSVDYLKPTIITNDSLISFQFSSYNGTRLDPQSFLPETSNPNLISDRIFLDKHLFTNPNDRISDPAYSPTREVMPWNDYSYSIEALFLYTSQSEREPNRLGLAIRGDTQIEIDASVVDGALYDLKGDCIGQYQPGNALIQFNTQAFSRKNVFEEEPSDLIDIEMICSALLISGNIQLLLGEEGAARQRHFMRWLNQGGPDLKREKIEFFHRTYSLRADHPFLEQYSLQELIELFSSLEKKLLTPEEISPQKTEKENSIERLRLNAHIAALLFCLTSIEGKTKTWLDYLKKDSPKIAHLIDKLIPLQNTYITKERSRINEILIKDLIESTEFSILNEFVQVIHSKIGFQSDDPSDAFLSWAKKYNLQKIVALASHKGISIAKDAEMAKLLDTVPTVENIDSLVPYIMTHPNQISSILEYLIIQERQDLIELLLLEGVLSEHLRNNNISINKILTADTVPKNRIFPVIKRLLKDQIEIPVHLLALYISNREKNRQSDREATNEALYRAIYQAPNLFSILFVHENLRYQIKTDDDKLLIKKLILSEAKITFGSNLLELILTGFHCDLNDSGFLDSLVRCVLFDPSAYNRLLNLALEQNNLFLLKSLFSIHDTTSTPPSIPLSYAFNNVLYSSHFKIEFVREILNYDRGLTGEEWIRDILSNYETEKIFPVFDLLKEHPHLMSSILRAVTENNSFHLIKYLVKGLSWVDEDQAKIIQENPWLKKTAFLSSIITNDRLSIDSFISEESSLDKDAINFLLKNSTPDTLLKITSFIEERGSEDVIDLMLEMIIDLNTPYMQFQFTQNFSWFTSLIAKKLQVHSHFMNQLLQQLLYSEHITEDRLNLMTTPDTAVTEEMIYNTLSHTKSSNLPAFISWMSKRGVENELEILISKIDAVVKSRQGEYLLDDLQWITPKTVEIIKKHPSLATKLIVRLIDSSDQEKLELLVPTNTPLERDTIQELVKYQSDASVLRALVWFERRKLELPNEWNVVIEIVASIDSLVVLNSFLDKVSTFDQLDPRLIEAVQKSHDATLDILSRLIQKEDRKGIDLLLLSKGPLTADTIDTLLYKSEEDPLPILQWIHSRAISSEIEAMIEASTRSRNSKVLKFLFDMISSQADPLLREKMTKQLIPNLLEHNRKNDLSQLVPNSFSLGRILHPLLAECHKKKLLPSIISWLASRSILEEIESMTERILLIYKEEKDFILHLSLFDSMARGKILATICSSKTGTGALFQALLNFEHDINQVYCGDYALEGTISCEDAYGTKYLLEKGHGMVRPQEGKPNWWLTVIGKDQFWSDPDLVRLIITSAMQADPTALDQMWEQAKELKNSNAIEAIQRWKDL